MPTQEKKPIERASLWIVCHLHIQEIKIQSAGDTWNLPFVRNVLNLPFDIG